MTPDDQLGMMILYAFILVLFSLAIGYAYGYGDGKASIKLWTKSEFNRKARSNE